MRAIDLTGQVFGGRQVVSRAGSSDQGVLWNCECKCGEKSIVPGKILRAGKRHNCLRCSWAASGNSTEDLYKTWWGVILRCTDPNNPAYSRYGGRGVWVSRRWLVFENFRNDMGSRPPGTSLDRIVNDKGYCKLNCRWATPQQQNRNRRDNVSLEYQGTIRLLVEWADMTGIKVPTLRRRLANGWSVEDTLTVPVRRWGR